MYLLKMSWILKSLIVIVVFFICVWNIVIERMVFPENAMGYEQPKLVATITVTPEPRRRFRPRPPPKRYITEKEILQATNNFYPAPIADASQSKLELINRQSSVFLGKDVRVLIHVFRENNEGSVGGDYLRVWMENQNLGASVSGDVIDHRNGSYTAILKAVWTGSAFIRAFLARGREEIALYYRLYRRYASMLEIQGGFKYGRYKETTVCSTVVYVGGGDCNFTSRNGGLPWFCKRPKQFNLSCGDWVTTKSRFRRTFHLNKYDEEIYQMDRHPGPYYIPDTVEITVNRTVHQSTILISEDVKCSRLRPEVTWGRKPPNGFFYNNTWRTILCQNTLPQTPKAYRGCLKGRTLWIPGDSTSIQFMEYFRVLLNLHHDGWRPRIHEPIHLRDRSNNFSIRWVGHEFPFYHGKLVHSVLDNIPEHVILDDLPNNTKDIVVMYLYVHFTLVHPDVFRQHVRRLVKSAERLVARAPGVTLIVRGPHAFYKSIKVKKGMSSYWGLLYADILQENFHHLRTKIFYLDFWDMSMARGSHSIHPDREIIKEMVHSMMTVICPLDP